MNWFEELEQAEQENEAKLEDEAWAYRDGYNDGYESGRADAKGCKYWNAEHQECATSFEEDIRADERTKIKTVLKKLIESDYNSRECGLLYSDFCEFLEEGAEQ